MDSWRRLWRVTLTAALAAALALPHGGPAAPVAGPQADDEQILKTARVGTDGPALLTYFRQRTVTAADRQRIETLIRQLGDPAYAVRERASADVIAVGLPAIGPLRDAAANPDVEIARRAERCLGQIERAPSAALSAAAARGVARTRPAGAVGVLLAYLPMADDEAVADEVREALAAVAVVADSADPALAAALADPSPLKRGAAAEALARTGLPAAIDQSRKALADANADVRLRIALALVTRAKDKAAIPAMIGLLADLPQGAGWRIEDVLIRLAGDAAPKVTLGEDAAAREKCRDAWKDWWDKNGATVDLAKLDAAPPMLGNTLVVLRDQRSGAGRIVELNTEKKELWKIDNLHFPSDAVVVGRDRVLIAEEQSQQVTERDLTGKVIWTKQVNQPIGVQRLANGNTFIVCRNQLIEIDARRVEVFSYQRPAPQFDICAAQKLRSGDAIFLTRTGQCIRLDAKGKEGRPFLVPPTLTYGGIDVLPNNHVLVTQKDCVAEYDGTGGAPVWQGTFSRPTSVQRLANGNTLVASGQSPTPTVAELDRLGHAVWEFKPTDGSLPWRARRR